MIPGLSAVLPQNLAGYSSHVKIGAERGQVRMDSLARDRASYVATTAAFARRFPGADDRATLSYWCQHYFAALIIPVFVTAVRLRRVLPLALDAIGCDVDELGLPKRIWLPHEGGPPTSGASREILEHLVEGHLRPFINGCSRWSGLSQRVLWCNAGTMLDFAASELGIEASYESQTSNGRDLQATGVLPTALARKAIDMESLLLEPFRLSPPGGRRIRRLCCLRFRLPGVKCCESVCPLKTSDFVSSF